MIIEQFWNSIETVRSTPESIDIQMKVYQAQVEKMSPTELVKLDELLVSEIFPIVRSYFVLFALTAMVDFTNWETQQLDLLCSWLLFQGKANVQKIVDNPDSIVNFKIQLPSKSLIDIIAPIYFARKGSTSRLLAPITISNYPETDLEFQDFVFKIMPLMFPQLMALNFEVLELQWHPSDRQLMSRLYHSGHDLNAPVQIDYAFTVKSQNDAINLLKHLEPLGHVKSNIFIHTNSVTLETTEIASPAAVTRCTSSLLRLCKENDAVYSGWGTSM
ncbi:MAG: ribonuclease E inhibitor RraB [Cyanobacteria bacterium REEB67]|nr:ribonuclease E inhibitor RraB [Cyanobacteria bacterium REEB67]